MKTEIKLKTNMKMKTETKIKTKLKLKMKMQAEMKMEITMKMEVMMRMNLKMKFKVKVKHLLLVHIAALMNYLRALLLQIATGELKISNVQKLPNKQLEGKTSTSKQWETFNSWHCRNSPVQRSLFLTF